MTHRALIFMLSAWAVVLSILIWSFAKLLRGEPMHHDEDAPEGP
ncbi:MAG: hypothetical protein PVJ02_13115 [Gemmatimonadota bacterium]|jgi:hypothetical protein